MRTYWFSSGELRIRIKNLTAYITQWTLLRVLVNPCLYWIFDINIIHHNIQNLICIGSLTVASPIADIFVIWTRDIKPLRLKPISFQCFYNLSISFNRTLLWYSEYSGIHLAIFSYIVWMFAMLTRSVNWCSQCIYNDEPASYIYLLINGWVDKCVPSHI